MREPKVVDFTPRWIKNLPPEGDEVLANGVMSGLPPEDHDQAVLEVLEATMNSSLVAPPQRLVRLFKQLAERWRAEILVTSSIVEIVTHPAYQRIIGLGPQVIPLILADLEEEPDHWFWALTALTGEDPVAPTDKGCLSAMTVAWLQWGRANGWIA